MTNEKSSLSPKLLAARAKHHSKRRESLQKLEISKTALERRGSGGDRTVDSTVSSSSMMSESSSSLCGTKIPLHELVEELPVTEEAVPVEDSQQSKKERSSLEYSLSRFEMMQVSNPSQELLTTDQSEEPTKVVGQFSDPPVSPRLNQIRKKHRKLRKESIYKLEASKSAMERLSSDCGDDDETGNSSVSPSSSSALQVPQHEQLALMGENEDLKEQVAALKISQSVFRRESGIVSLNTTSSSSATTPRKQDTLALFEENEDLKEQVSVLLISQAVARKEYQKKIETIRNLHVGFQYVASKEMQRIQQQLQEIVLRCEKLQTSVGKGKQQHDEQQKELEGLQEQLSKVQKQLENAMTNFEEQQEHQDWLVEWSRTTGQEAKHTLKMLGALEIADPESQTRLQNLRGWLDRWSQVAQTIEDLNKNKNSNANDNSSTQKQRKDNSAKTVTPPRLSKIQLSRSLGPSELEVLKAETAQVIDTLRTLRAQLDETEDDDEIQFLEEQIEEQLEFWDVLERHMDELTSMKGEEQETKAPRKGPKSISNEAGMAQSAETLQRLLVEMQTMISNHIATVHGEAEGKSSLSVSSSFVCGSKLIRISSNSPWTPASALTLLLAIEQQQVLMEVIQDQTSQIQQLQKQEEQVKVQLELAQSTMSNIETKRQGVPYDDDGLEGVDEDRQGISTMVSILEKQVQQLQNENATLLSTIQEQNDRHDQALGQKPNEVNVAHALSPSTTQNEVSPQLSQSSFHQSSKKTTAAERNKLAYDTAQAYFSRKQRQSQVLEESPEEFKLSVRQMDLSIRQVSSPSKRFSSTSVFDEAEIQSNRRQSRLLSRHIIGNSESRKPLIFVNEGQIEKAQQEQQVALQTKLKSFLGINW
ncbi:unnamed protein product [Cylindrotheca closterium]|uniref:Uncharacterized protein n=1 Tax=Cylindrotheca closterium TaxID=2856 RepID=A0AAD2FYS0_9STRA|nr:unnamed protein product [Cylindrotheca closterium]